MTIPPSSTTNSSSSILRSHPRYTSSSSTNDDNFVVEDTSPSSSTKLINDDTATQEHQTIEESVAKRESIAKDNNKSTSSSTIRTLSDLVQSSVNLSTEVHGTKDISERGNIISHRPKSGTSQFQQENDYGKVKENSDNKVAVERAPATTLYISKDGKPYLSNTPAVNDIADIKERTQDMSEVPSTGQQQQQTSSGLQVVDIIGIMDNDTQNVVRFCELNDEDDNTMHNNNGGSNRSRDRLEQRIPFENDIEDVNMDSIHHEQGDDDEESCSSGSDQDDEILKELGLYELIEEKANEDDNEGMDNEDTGMEDERIPEESTIRTFRTFWELLTRWATSSTVDLVLSYQGVRPTMNDDLPVATISQQNGCGVVEESKLDDSQQQRCYVNIGASRQQAIMSMIKMCLARSLSELNKISTVQDEHGIKVDQRRVEQRLADLVRTFDTSTGGADLNMKMWKGLTAILIMNVFDSSANTENSSTKLPKSIQTLGLCVEEYQYLTRSVFTSLKGMP